MPAADETTRMTRRTTLASALSAGLFLGAFVVVGGVRSQGESPAVTVTRASAAPLEATTAESLVVTKRQRRERHEQAKRRLARASRLGAAGARVENPCLRASRDVCEHTALEPFFRALDDLEHKRAKRHATVAVLGNSLIASDHIVDVVRERLVERFGDGGRGFVLADRIAGYGPRTRTGKASAGRWAAHNFSMGERGDYPFGVAGVLHVSKGRATRTSWPIDGQEKARVFFYDHERSPSVNVVVDDAIALTVASEQRGAVRTIDVPLGDGAASLALEATGSGAVVYGALFERRSPGVVLSSFGVPAADATHFLSADRAVFADQLTAQDPSLVVVMLGGNEIKRLHWGRRRREDVEQAYGALLDRLHEVVPGAACLGIGPIDSVYGGPEKVWRTRAQLAWVVEMQKRVALEKGCAYFDLFEAMGGAGALRRFSAHGLLHDDMVHPRQAGLDLLGELIADALLSSYEATPVVTRVPARSAAHEETVPASDG